MNSKIKFFTSFAAASIILAGCGGGGGGSSAPASPVTQSGVVSDGYIYNAKVCYLNTDICTVTGSNGQFTIEKKDLPLVVETNSSTVNTVTTSNFSSILIAPAGVTTVSPLSSALYAVNGDYNRLADVLDVSTDTLKNYMNSDYVKLAEDNNTEAKILYAKNILLEKAVESLMLDSNISDGNEKINALKSLINYTYDTNKTLTTLTSSDLENIYKSYRQSVNMPVDNTSAQKIALIAYAYTGVNDCNFSNTNVQDLEKKLAQVDMKKMFSLDESNLSTSVHSLQSLVSSMTSDENNSAVTNVAAYNIIQDTTQSVSPEINATGYIYVKDLNSDSVISINAGKDFNLSSGAVYSVTMQDENGVFEFEENSQQALYDHSGNVEIKVNTDKMTKPIESVVLTFTPKSGDIVGQSKQMIVLVNKPQNTVSGVISETFNADENGVNVIKTLNFYADADTGYQIPDENKTVDVKIDNPDDNSFIFATSSNPDVIQVGEYNDTDVKLNTVFNGTAKVTIVSLNKQTYTPSFLTYNVNINGVDLPPVLNVTDTYKEAVLPDSGGAVNVEIPYTITDTDGVNNGFSVKGCDTVAYGTEGNITCSFDTAGLHTVTLTANDGYLNSSAVNVNVNVTQGDVAPVLYVNIPATVDMNTVTSKEYSYVASDVNPDDTVTVKAESSNTSVVNVSVDENTSTIKLSAGSVVGQANVTVWAVDKSGLKSREYNFTVNTTNQLSELVSQLYIVPVMKDDGSPVSNRYELKDFNASYDIGNNEILINGDINTTGGDVKLNDFVLKVYPDDGYYAGKNSDNTYGFIFDNGFSYSGQFQNGSVLVFDENGKTPYYWALATPEEICNAYGENNDIISYINSLNNKKPIDCSK